MIQIDGKSGGGQVLRTSLSLSMVTGQPFTIENIRGTRPKPGLMRQHLTCVKAAAEVAGANIDEVELGSRSKRCLRQHETRRDRSGKDHRPLHDKHWFPAKRVDDRSTDDDAENGRPSADKRPPAER